MLIKFNTLTSLKVVFLLVQRSKFCGSSKRGTKRRQAQLYHSFRSHQVVTIIPAMGWVLYLFIALVVVVCLLLMVLIHAGYFYSLRIRTSIPLSVPRKVAYRLHIGAYSNSGTTYGELLKLAPRLTTFGIYYDDPKRVSVFYIAAIPIIMLVDLAIEQAALA